VTAGPTARLDCLLDGGEAIEIRAPHEIALAFRIGDRLTLRPREARVW
jgi:hypothetical protein